MRVLNNIPLTLGSWILLMLFLPLIILGQATQAPPQDRSILLVNGTAHLATGKVIKKAAIGFKNGEITDVINANIVDVSLLKFDTVIDVSGKHIYPGFIAPNSVLGLVEIEAVRASRDEKETGNINPNVRSIIAYNTDSKVTPTVRSNGVLMAQITPRGGMISGSSSVVELDGWNWEDAAYKVDEGIHLNWPKFRTHHNKKPDEVKKMQQKRTDRIEELKRFFQDAKAYAQSDFNYEQNLRYEAMRKLFDGEARLYIHANKVREISEAIYFIRDFDLEKVTIVGGYDAWRIPELLVDNNVSVILRRVHALPMRSHEDIDLPYRIPALLKEAGVAYCLDLTGKFEAMGTRNLPFMAGTTTAYGLTEEEALQTITINAAKILGIDDKLGTIEKGKWATIIVSSGDALDMRTNQIEMAFIRGRAIDLDNHQKQLYHKYKAKYEN